jgi:hypothetical protein
VTINEPISPARQNAMNAFAALEKAVNSLIADKDMPGLMHFSSVLTQAAATTAGTIESIYVSTVAAVQEAQSGLVVPPQGLLVPDGVRMS